MLKTLITTAALTLFVGLLLVVGRAEAAVRCEIQYGGGEVCIRTAELQINKKIFDPTRNIFVDNLGLTSKRFSPGEEIRFQLQITNVGHAPFSKVTVQDTLPPEVELTSGSLSFEITDLSPGETEKREIRARVVSADRLPKNLDCEVENVAVTRADDQVDRDRARFCVEKAAAPVEELPEAGAELWFLGLAAAAVGGYGLYLLKFSKRYIERG